MYLISFQTFKANCDHLYRRYAFGKDCCGAGHDHQETHMKNPQNDTRFRYYPCKEKYCPVLDGCKKGGDLMEDPHLFCDVEDAAKMQYDPCMGFLCLNRIDATPHELLLADEAINHYGTVLTDLAEAREWNKMLGIDKVEAYHGEMTAKIDALKAERSQLRDALERQKAHSKFLSDEVGRLRGAFVK